MTAWSPTYLSLSKEVQLSVAEWPNKGLMTAWSPLLYLSLSKTSYTSPATSARTAKRAASRKMSKEVVMASL
eukprot:1764556-Pyramimonas_sp.AAC.2